MESLKKELAETKNALAKQLDDHEAMKNQMRSSIAGEVDKQLKKMKMTTHIEQLQVTENVP